MTTQCCRKQTVLGRSISLCRGEFILLMTCFMNRAIKMINLARSSAV